MVWRPALVVCDRQMMRSAILASARNHKSLPVDEHSPCLSLLLLSSAFQGFSVFRTKRFETQRKGGKERYGRNLRFVALAPCRWWAVSIARMSAAPWPTYFEGLPQLGRPTISFQCEAYCTWKSLRMFFGVRYSHRPPVGGDQLRR